MNIYYLVRNDIRDQANIGFVKKFQGQIKTFCKFGDVIFVHIESGAFCAEYIPENDIEFAETRKVKRTGPLMQLFYHRCTRKLFNKAPPDVLYIRYKIAEPNFLSLLKYVNKFHPVCKIFLEFANFPYDQNFKDESFVKKILLPVDVLFRTQLHKYVHFAVNFNKSTDIYGIETLCLMNGVDPENLPLKEKVSDEGDDLVLLGVASLGYWHGYDRLIRGMKEFYENDKNTKKVVFNIVGEGAELPKLKKLTREIGLSDYVRFHGLLTGNELDKIFNDSHVGISSLGMHRLNISTYTVLKSREYACRGIPFVLSGHEKGFPKGFKYIKYVPNDDSPVNIKEIIEFYDEIKRDKDHGLILRKYAEENFSWNRQLKDVTDRFAR